MAYRGPLALEKNVGLRIRAMREAIGRTGREVAADIGISPGHYSHLELGRRNILVGELQKLADAFQCSVADFFIPLPCVEVRTDEADLEAACTRFNEVYPAGSKLHVWAGSPAERAAVSVVVGKAGARVLGGHTAAVSVIGDVALAHVVRGRA